MVFQDNFAVEWQNQLTGIDVVDDNGCIVVRGKVKAMAVWCVVSVPPVAFVENVVGACPRFHHGICWICCKIFAA